jgi:hypothetical protein
MTTTAQAGSTGRINAECDGVDEDCVQKEHITQAYPGNVVL